MQNRFSVKKMALLAMLAAVAYMMVSLIRIPVVLFLKSSYHLNFLSRLRYME